MGILSVKQSEYIKRLIERNAVIIEALVNTENEYARRLLQDALMKPLNEPMPRGEESIRRRLRKKAQKYAEALAILNLAGITPKREKGYQSLDEYAHELVNQVYSELVVLLMTGKKDMIGAWIAAKINEIIE